MRTLKEINAVLSNPDLAIKEREEFVNILTEEEMRNVFIQMCGVYATTKPIKESVLDEFRMDLRHKAL